MFRWVHTIVLFFVAFTLPFGFTNLDLGFVVLTPAKFASALLAVLVAAHWALSPSRSLQIGWRGVWLLLFLVSVAVSTASSFFGGLPVQPVVTTAITWVSLVALAGLLSYTIQTERSLSLVLGAYVAGAVYVAVTGLAGEGFVTSSAEGVRIGGEGGNSNEAAFHLVLGVALAFAMMQTAARPRMRIVWAGVAVLLIVAAGATLSRSGLLALLFMGALWVLRFRRFDVLRVAIPVVVLIAIAAALMPESVGERLETLSPEKANRDTSILSRKELLPLALRAFAENPLIGIGMSGWVSWAVAHRATHAEVIHNAHVHVAAEQGLLGLVPFTALTLMTWWDLTRTWKFVRRKRDLPPALRNLAAQALYLQLGYLGCLVVAQFQPAMRYKGLWFCFALSGTLIALTRRRAAELVARPSQDSRPARGVAIAHA
jgi:O-antigen ligase